jgi:radical SAM superfamily enzyme YgiQ (UPF0313 family)
MFDRVALVALPKQDLLRPPGALPILAAACEEFNIDYDIYDFNLWLYKNIDRSTWQLINDNWEAANPFDHCDDTFYKIFISKLKQYVDILLSYNPTLVSISIFSDVSAHCAVELIKKLNSTPQRTQFKIVIGGTGIRAALSIFNHKSLCESLLEKKQIDFFIFGEGEIAFRKLLNNDIPYPGINNFNAIQIEDLDQFPFPSYNKITPGDYEYIVNPEIIITGSRGCVRKCTYCDVAKYWPKFRYRSGVKIADELYYYYKNNGIKNFEFSDSLINGSLKQFREMNLKLIEYKKTDPTFNINFKGQFICRPSSQMKEEDYRNMKLAGCDYIYVGIESFSDKVRYDMDKKFKTVDIDYHLKLCGKYGIKNTFLMIVGYPTETQQDHDKNLEILKKYQVYALSNVISMIVFGYTTSILEDTPLFHLQEELGIVEEFNNVGDFNSANWVSTLNPTLTLTERIRRWLELSELASELGYTMPRNQHYIKRYIEILTTIKDRPKEYKKISIAPIHD